MIYYTPEEELTADVIRRVIHSNRYYVKHETIRNQSDNIEFAIKWAEDDDFITWRERDTALSEIKKYVDILNGIQNKKDGYGLNFSLFRYVASCSAIRIVEGSNDFEGITEFLLNWLDRPFLDRPKSEKFVIESDVEIIKSEEKPSFFKRFLLK